MKHAFDDHALTRLLGPDPVRQRRVYALFVDTGTRTLTSMRAALDGADLVSLGVAAHRLKSAALLVGAPALGALAAQLEAAAAADEGNGSAIAPMLSELEEEVTHALDWVRARLQALAEH